MAWSIPLFLSSHANPQAGSTGCEYCEAGFVTFSLAHSPVQVVQSADGPKALQLLQHMAEDGAPPAAVLLSRMLPGMDG